MYAAAVRGINYLIHLLEDCATSDRQLLIGFFVGLDTSSHPFLAQNPSVRFVVRWLIASVYDSIETDAAVPGFDLGLLCDLHFATRYLPSRQRAALEPLLAEARRSLQLHRRRYLSRQRRACARVAHRSARSKAVGPRINWEGRLLEVLDQRHAEVLGLALDNDAYYSSAVRELKTLSFCRAYELELFNLLTHTSYGLSLWHRRPVYGNNTAESLCTHGLEFLDWLQAASPYRDDPEILAGCADAFLKGGPFAWGWTSHLGNIVRILLDTQASDGGWATARSEPRGLAGDDLYACYHPV
jgi:hypothetical protein